MQDDALVVSELAHLGGVHPFDQKPAPAILKLGPPARVLDGRGKALAGWEC